MSKLLQTLCLFSVLGFSGLFASNAGAAGPVVYYRSPVVVRSVRPVVRTYWAPRAYVTPARRVVRYSYPATYSVVRPVTYTSYAPVHVW